MTYDVSFCYVQEDVEPGTHEVLATLPPSQSPVLPAAGDFVRAGKQKLIVVRLEWIFDGDRAEESTSCKVMVMCDPDLTETRP